MKTTNVNQPGERSHGIVRGHIGATRAGSAGIDFTNSDGSEIDGVTTVALQGLRGSDLGDGTMGLTGELGTANLEAITPTQLAANTDNWAPVDATLGTTLAEATIVRVSTDASRNLTGIVAPDPATERLVILENVGAFDLVLKHNVTSTAANRFYCPNDADVTLTKDSAIVIEYDATSARWRVVGGVTRAGGGVPWLYAKADGGLAGDGVTDDTAAFQALINTATASGTKSGWIWFEPGDYLIGGALQDTGAFNGQIVLPFVDPTTKPLITLTLQGPAKPQVELSYPIGGGGQGFADIRSSLTGASGTAAMISGGNSGYNNIQVVIRDLIFICPDNPTLTALNLAHTNVGLRENVLITTLGMFSASYTQPTHSNAYGIKYPGDGNGSLNVERTVMVVGFYTGHLMGELENADILAYLCIRGIEIPFTNHIGGNIRLQTLSCPYGIYLSGVSYTDIIYDAEHRNVAGYAANNPAWAANVYDLDDASNQLHGHIRWFGVASGVGADHVFLVNGGTNAAYEEFGALPSAAVGGLTGFATPAIVLGTAAAAGAATTAIRSDSTIVAFDATVPAAIGTASAGSAAVAARRNHVHPTGAGTPTTAAFGDAPATGSGPAAAMTDHRHGMPASPTVTEAQIYNVGGHWELLMDPATSSPPVPLTTSDGTDWVYGWLSDGG